MYPQFTIAQMRVSEKTVGNHWFGKSEMRSFGTRLPKTVMRYNIFITSEWADFAETKRAYTVRMFLPASFGVATISEYLGFTTQAKAQTFAKRVIEKLQGLDQETIDKIAKARYAFYRLENGKEWIEFIISDDEHFDLYGDFTI